MLQYILKRLLIMIPTVFFISFICFWIIQLPPGDYVTTYAAQLVKEGETVDKAALDAMRASYGLDKPVIVQYGIWISKILFHGDFGFSFEWNQKVSTLILDKLGLTMIISFSSLVFTYLLAIPIGIYGATHQYSPGDYITAFIGFLGMAIPGFLLAIILMYISFKFFGNPMIGLFSSQYANAPWSLGKVLDLLKHMIIPVIIIGTQGTCSLIRVMRGQLLDELKKMYVVTAKAKGVAPKTVLYKYPVRASLGPLVSTIGWSLTKIFSGSTITAIVLNLPIMGPLLYKSLLSQDMYLAGGILFIMSILTVIGTLLSDIGLAWLDPRVRHEKEAA